MSDWMGIVFFALFALGVYFGLRMLARPVRKTDSEFEQRVAASTSMLNASMNALHELLHPEAAKSKVVQMELKEGRYGKKRREGKAGDESGTDDPDQENN